MRDSIADPTTAIKFTCTAPPARRQIRILVDISPSPPTSVECVPPPLAQEQIEEATTKLAVPQTDIYIFVSVSDSGPGLKSSDLELLFQRFQQGSNSEQVFGGSGLGLFVSRKLCGLMGGNIDLDSAHRPGATFRFYICSKTAPNPLPQASILAPPSERVPVPEPTTDTFLSPGGNNVKVVLPEVGGATSPSRTHLHVLITEDNIINQTVLNRQLRKAGFDTSLANNGKEAIEQIMRLQAEGGHQLFDCILVCFFASCHLIVIYDIARYVDGLRDAGDGRPIGHS